MYDYWVLGPLGFHHEYYYRNTVTSRTNKSTACLITAVATLLNVGGCHASKRLASNIVWYERGIKAPNKHASPVRCKQTLVNRKASKIQTNPDAGKKSIKQHNVDDYFHFLADVNAMQFLQGDWASGSL